MIIGRPQGDHLRLEAVARPFPDAADHFGRNLLEARVDLAAGPFDGSYRARLRTWELEEFGAALRALQRSGEGVATLDARAGGLLVEVSAEGADRFVARCVARDTGRSDARVEFTLGLERAELSAILRDLDATLAAFPVVRGA